MLELRQEVVRGLPSRVWRGGSGPPLVLLHGGYGGAAIHWASVWDSLAERFDVVAPEFPGMANGTPRGPGSYDAFARWLEGLLDALEIEAAWVVGNSFGATVGWQFASHCAQRCRGLVVADGAPPMELSALTRFLIRSAPLKQLWTAAFARALFGPTAHARIFADSRFAPAELVELLSRYPAHIDLIREVLLAGDPPAPAPQTRTLLVWGAADKILDARVAHRVHEAARGSRLRFIAGAGHLPQVERPEEFVEAVTSFIAETDRA